MGHFWKEVFEKGLLPKGPILAMSHFSKRWSKFPEGTKELLWLSGNTHAGQVLTAKWIRPYLFSGKGKWLYVNQGLGTT